MDTSRTLLVFLVLSISSVSRGQNETAVTTDTQDVSSASSNETTGLPPTPGPTSAAQTDRLATVSTTRDEGTNATERATAPLTSVSSRDAAALPTTGTPLATQDNPGGVPDREPSSWGYVVLALIILVIIVLSVILYFLRRASQTYSFDLHSAPANRPDQTAATFERVRLDDLDRTPATVVTACDLSPPAVSNGSTRQAEEEPRANGQSVPAEEPDAGGPETPPTADPGDPGPSLGGPASCTNLFFDAVGVEQQNENNNHPCEKPHIDTTCPSNGDYAGIRF